MLRLQNVLRVLRVFLDSLLWPLCDTLSTFYFIITCLDLLFSYIDVCALANFTFSLVMIIHCSIPVPNIFVTLEQNIHKKSHIICQITNVISWIPVSYMHRKDFDFSTGGQPLCLQCFSSSLSDCLLKIGRAICNKFFVTWQFCPYYLSFRMVPKIQSSQKCFWIWILSWLLVSKGKGKCLLMVNMR